MSKGCLVNAFVFFPVKCFGKFFGAEDESRTHKVLLPQVPETCASAISPLPHIKLRNIFYQKIYFVFAQVSKPSRLPLPPQKLAVFLGTPDSPLPHIKLRNIFYQKIYFVFAQVSKPSRLALPPQKLAVFWGPRIRHFRIKR